MFSLKPCPDCGHDVSSLAAVCPHCGRELNLKDRIIVGVLLGLILAYVIYALLPYQMTHALLPDQWGNWHY